MVNIITIMLIINNADHAFYHLFYGFLPNFPVFRSPLITYFMVVPVLQLPESLQLLLADHQWLLHLVSMMTMITMMTMMRLSGKLQEDNSTF